LLPDVAWGNGPAMQTILTPPIIYKEKPSRLAVVSRDWMVDYRHPKGESVDFRFRANRDRSRSVLDVTVPGYWVRLLHPVTLAPGQHYILEAEIRSLSRGLGGAIHRIHILECTGEAYDPIATLARDVPLTGDSDRHRMTFISPIASWRHVCDGRFYISVQFNTPGIYEIGRFTLRSEQVETRRETLNVPTEITSSESDGLELPLLTPRSLQMRRAAELNKQIAESHGPKLIVYALEALATCNSVEDYDRALELSRFLLARTSEMDKEQLEALVTHSRATAFAIADWSVYKSVLLRTLNIPAAHSALNELEATTTGTPVSVAELSSQTHSFARLAQASAREDASSKLAVLQEVSRRLVKNPQLNLLLSNISQELAQNRSEGQELFVYYANRYLAPTGTDQIQAIGQGENWLDGLVFRQGTKSPIEIGRRPRVSVLMAAFNAEKTLGYAARSILDQTYRNIELLICDDRSDDATFEIARELARRDDRVRVFRSNSRQGPYNIRNSLIEQASGDFITFQDADDVSFPSRIERQVARLMQGDVDLVTTRWIRVRAKPAFVFFPDDFAAKHCVVSLMARAEIFRSLGRFTPARFGADTEFFENARQELGSARHVELKQALLFGLWEPGSITLTPGFEANMDGYRSPARRLYAQLAFLRRAYGDRFLPEEQMVAKMNEAGILLPDAGITEVEPTEDSRLVSVG
jgi:hypothetical protein